MACKQCGDCCQQFTFTHLITNPKETNYEDAKKFLEMHKGVFVTEGIKKTRGRKHAIKVLIHTPCVHLRDITPEGSTTKKYECTIYDERPKICQNFKCRECYT